MKWTIVGVRVFLGLFLLANGLNMWLHFLPVQVPESQAANDLMQGLVSSGLFAFVKYIEVACGLMLVFNRFVPFALIVMMPLTIVIAWVDFVLIGSSNSIIFGALLVIPHVLLMTAYLRPYMPMLAMRSEPGVPSKEELLDAVMKTRSQSALRT
ncbi:MAG: DoxX family membrane protein [Hyphomonadaceae bacterium]